MADSLIEYISCSRGRLFLKELQKYGEVVLLNEVYGRNSSENHHIIMGTVKNVDNFVSDENGSLIKLKLHEYCRSLQKLKYFFAFVYNEFATALKNANLQPGDCIAFRNISAEKNTMVDFLPGWHDLDAILGYQPKDGAKIFLMKANVEKPSFNDKPVATNNALPQRATRKFHLVDMYKYTRISNITEASLECMNSINVYGVVKTIIKEPTQEGKHATVCVMDETCDNNKDFLVHIFFKRDPTCPNIEVNDIIRFHRMKVEQFNCKLDGRVFRSSDIVVFPPYGKDYEGARSTAQSYHFTASDADRLAELRRWIVSQQAPSSSESKIESIDHDLRATVLKDVTEKGRYKIECKNVEKPSFNDKPVATNNALPQRATRKFHLVDMYKYTRISNITEASLECMNSINVYGVVKTIIKEPTQEGKHATVCVMDETCDNNKDFLVHIFFKRDPTCPNIEVNDIIRFHRMKVEQFNCKLDGRVFRSSDIVVFPPYGKDYEGARSTAQSYHFTASDADRLAELRRWIVSQQAPSSSESKIESIDHDLRATVLKDVTEKGRYKIECKNVEKPSFNDKPVATNNALPQRATRKFHLVDMYKYTRISNITEASLECMNSINVYGVVKTIIKEPTQEGKHATVCVMDETCDNNKDFLVHIFFKRDPTCPNIEVNDIIRFHRMKVEQFNCKLDGRVFRSSDIVVFPPYGKDYEGARSTAQSYHFTTSDADRLAELRRWIVSQQAPSSSESKIESIDHDLRATVLKDVTEKGRYKIECKVLNKEATSDGVMVLTVVDGTVHPILGCYEVKITVTDPPEQFKQLKVPSLVSLEEVTASKNDPHTAQSILFFTMSGPDCFYETLKGNDPRGMQLKRRIQKMKQASGDTPINLAEVYLCTDFAASTLEESDKKEWEISLENVDSTLEKLQQQEVIPESSNIDPITPKKDFQVKYTVSPTGKSLVVKNKTDYVSKQCEKDVLLRILPAVNENVENLEYSSGESNLRPSSEVAKQPKNVENSSQNNFCEITHDPVSQVRLNYDSQPFKKIDCTPEEVGHTYDSHPLQSYKIASRRAENLGLVIAERQEQTGAVCHEQTGAVGVEHQKQIEDLCQEKTVSECQDQLLKEFQDLVNPEGQDQTAAECQEQRRSKHEDQVKEKSQEGTRAECQGQIISEYQDEMRAEFRELTRIECQENIKEKCQDQLGTNCQEHKGSKHQDRVIDKSQEKTNAECQEEIRTECQELTRTQFGAEASSGYEDYVRAECREQLRKESEERADFQQGELPPISDFSDNPSDVDIQSYKGNFMKLGNGSAARDMSSETYSEFSEAIRSKKDAEIFTSTQKCGNEPSSQTNDPFSDCKSEIVPSSSIDENKCPPRFSAISKSSSESVDSSRNSGHIELEFLSISGTSSSSSNNNISNTIQCAELSEKHQFYNESRPEESDIFSTTTSMRSKTTIRESSEHSFLSVDHKQNAPIRVDINSSSVNTKSSANQITNITEFSFLHNKEKNLPDMLQKMNIYAEGNFTKVDINNEIEDISKNNVRTETSHTSLVERDLQNSEKYIQEDVVQSYTREDLPSRAEQNYQSIPENLATSTNKPESYHGNNLQDKCNTEFSEDSCYSNTKGSSERVYENTVARNLPDFNITTEDCHTNRKKSDNNKRKDLLQCTVTEIRDDLHANRREIDKSKREDLPMEVSIEDMRDVRTNTRTSGISERDDSSQNMSSITEQDDIDGSSNVREYVECGRNKVCSQDVYMVLKNSQNEEISMKKNINLEPVKGQIESTSCPFQPSSFHISGDKFTFASGIVRKKGLKECCFHEIRRQPDECVVRGWLSHLEPPLHDTFPLNNIVSGVCDECRRIYSFMSLRYDPRTHTAFCVTCLQKGLTNKMELIFVLLLHLLDENNDELVGTVSGFSADEFLGCTTMTYLEDEHTYHRVNNMLSKLLLTDSSTPAKERGPMLKLKVIPIATSTGLEFAIHDTSLFIGSG